MFKLLENSQELYNFSGIEDINTSFSKSITFHPKIEHEIENIYQRTLNNQAKFLIGSFHLNIFNTIEHIVNVTNEADDFIFDSTDFIQNYFNKVENQLNIRNILDLNRLIYILRLSSILLESAEKDKDLEVIYEAFYQLESRLKDEHLLNESILSKNDEYIEVEYIITNDFHKLIENESQITY